MAIDLAGYDTKATQAVQAFWGNRQGMSRALLKS